MTTRTKLIITAVVVVVVGIIVYLIVKNTGNKYASGATLNKIKKGGYAPFVEWPEQSVRDAADQAAAAFDGNKTNGTAFADGVVYGAAWLKGMNIGYTSANINEFKDDIKKYVQNKSLRQPHWVVTPGEYLNAK